MEADYHWQAVIINRSQLPSARVGDGRFMFGSGI
jgi:hypothetical protein